MANKKITINSVKLLKPGETLWDTDVNGFGCRCQVKAKTFIMKYRFHGRQRIYTIGKCGDITPDQARKEAEKLRGQIRQGTDPMAEKHRAKAIPFVQDAFLEYLKEIKAKRSARTHAEYKRLFDKHAKKEIGSYKVSAVIKNDITRIHNKLQNTPYQANRVLAMLSSFFSWCLSEGHRTKGKNPCAYIDRFEEKSRERLISEAELYNLGQALIAYEEEYKYLKEQPHKKNKSDQQIENNTTPYITAAIRLLILTGARLNEILTLEWKRVDFDRKLIRLQESKTGQKTIYLSAPALQLLSELPRIEGNPYVIPGKKDKSHLVNIKDPWSIIRQKAGLEDVRIHDLRHNYASTAVTTGHHLKVVGTLLGHSNSLTTEKYAHLANDPLQTANEAVNKRILEAMTRKPDGDKVTKLHG